MSAHILSKNPPLAGVRRGVAGLHVTASPPKLEFSFLSFHSDPDPRRRHAYFYLPIIPVLFILCSVCGGGIYLCIHGQTYNFLNGVLWLGVESTAISSLVVVKGGGAIASFVLISVSFSRK